MIESIRLTASQLFYDSLRSNLPEAGAYPLVDAFDYVFWFGDLNFLINGTREVVDGMLENHMHDYILVSDQLTMLWKVPS